jgi:outer membrane protein OmpA-like peptidoglycan-associated protein/streptogramin lyase
MAISSTSTRATRTTARLAAIAVAAGALVVVGAVPARADMGAPDPTTFELASGSLPYGGVVDAEGNFYGTAEGTSTLYKITPSGEVTQGWSALPSGTTPEGVTIDSVGNIYTANIGNGTVSKVTPAGVVTGVWAALPDGANPVGIVVDSADNVYVANQATKTIAKITPEGVLTHSWAALPGHPYGLAVDSADNVYSANMSTSNISKVTPDGVVTSAWATLASGAGPQWLAIDSNDTVYSANYGNSTVSKITADGAVTDVWASLIGRTPLAIAVDSQNNVYTGNLDIPSIDKIYPNGELTDNWGMLPSGTWPAGIVISQSDDIYVANYEGDSVTRFEANPTVAGAPRLDTATADVGEIALRFRAPGSTGHSSIIRYEVSLDGGSSWTTLAFTGTGLFSATLTGLIRGATYSVALRAVNTMGDGQASDPVDVTVLTDPAPSTGHKPSKVTKRRGIPVPKHPNRYRGPQRATVAKYESYKGIQATPIPSLTRNLRSGQAATLSGAGLFAYSSDRIAKGGRAQVRALAKRLSKANTIRCEGYTDYASPNSLERRLSKRRAVAICKALEAAGADVRWVAVGYGGSRPAVVGGTAWTRAANRRVVVVVVN